MMEKFVENTGPNDPKDFGEKGVKMRETKQRTASEIIRSWPKGEELRNEKLLEIAEKTQERLSVQVSPVQHDDGWFIHLPDGKSFRLTRHGEVPPNKRLYVVYNPDGNLSYSTSGPIGVDVGMLLSKGPDFGSN